MFGKARSTVKNLRKNNKTPLLLLPPPAGIMGECNFLRTSLYRYKHRVDIRTLTVRCFSNQNLLLLLLQEIF